MFNISTDVGGMHCVNHLILHPSPPRNNKLQYSSVQYSKKKTVQCNKLVTCHQLKRKFVPLILCSVTSLVCSTDSTAALLHCSVLQYFVNSTGK